MGGSSSKGQQQQVSGSQSVLTPLVQNLFGQPTYTHPTYGFLAGDPNVQGATFQFANPLYGPDSWGGLAGLNQTTDLGDQGVDIPGLIGTSAAQQRELAQTGFKTSVDPAVALSRMLFEQEFVPGALEQFGGLGLDARDADTQAALLREGSRRATELGALDIDLSEAAAARRMAGLQAAPGLLDLQNLGLTTDFATSDAGQLLNRILMAAGQPTQTNVAGGGSEGRKGGGILFG